jgi:stage III sporulation protein AG
MRTVFINLKDKFFSPNCRRKNIENLVIFLVGVVIVIITGSYIFGNNEDKKVVESSTNNIFDAELFENKLAKILSEIKGAGNVKVMVSYHTGIETVPLSDTKDSNTVTEENDTGRVRKTEQSSVETSIIFNQEKSGNKIPYISKTIMPVVEGVIVTCDGGGDETVRANMIKAVTVITGISADKVQVFPKKNK